MALPASLQHVVWFWSTPCHGGSEGWYVVRPNDDVQATLAALGPIHAARAKLLGDNATLIGCRCSIKTDSTGVPQTRKGLFQKLAIRGTQTSVDSPDPANAVLSTNDPLSLQLTVVHTPTFRKKLVYLGAPWSRVVPGDNQYVPDFGQWNAYFNNWGQLMTQFGFGFIGRTVSSQTSITNYTVDPATGYVTLTVDPAVVWPNNDVVQVNIDWPGKRLPMEGVLDAHVLSPTQLLTVKPYGMREFDGVPGKLRLYEDGFYAIKDVNPNTQLPGFIQATGPVRKKRGRSICTTRGRVPAIPRW